MDRGYRRQSKDTSDSREMRSGRQVVGRVEGVDRHPFFLQSMVGINNYYLRKDMISGYRDTFVDLMGEKKV